MRNFLINFLKSTSKNSLETIIKEYIKFKALEEPYIQQQIKDFMKLEKQLPDFFKKEALEQRFIISIRKHLKQYEGQWFWGFMKEFNLLPQYLDFFMFMDEILGLSEYQGRPVAGYTEPAKNSE